MGSPFVQPRRWAVDHIRRRCGQIAEQAITPQEARTALLATMLQAGFKLKRLISYDQNKDLFITKGEDPNTGREHDVNVPGAVVAKVVLEMRRQGGTFDKSLLRPSEIGKLLRKFAHEFRDPKIDIQEVITDPISRKE